ncbi:hypothetical protein BGZ95_000299, partial [Linnemannia exigua]
SALVPNAVYSVAYTTIDESIFIIQGGGKYQNSTSSIVTSQFITLDTTTSGWNTSNPPWKSITIPAALAPTMTTWWHSISVSPNGQILTFWDSSRNGSLASYNRTRHDEWSSTFS